MSGKLNKKIRKQAAQLATESKSYLVKKTTKVFTDLQGNHIPYMVDQTVLHPYSAKSLVKLLNKFTQEGYDMNKLQGEGGIKALVSLENSGKLSELAANGYTLVK